METKKSLRLILNEFKLKKDFYYFNYANLARVPKAVIRESKKFLSLYNYGSFLSKKVENYQENVRSHVASVFGGKVENWYFQGTVASAIGNVLLHIIRDFENEKKRRPVISTYKMNFPSLIMPAINLASQEKCYLKLLDYPDEGIDNKWLENNLNSDIFIISLVDFFNGAMHDLNLIYDYCKSKDILLIVDFSQFPYWGILNVDNFPDAIFISVLHKWLLGYPGNSILYINKETPPFFQSWMNMRNIFDYETQNLSKSYEIANKNPLAFACFEGAFKLCNKIGFDKINRYLKSSNIYLTQNLKSLSEKYSELKIIEKKINSNNGLVSTIDSISIGEKTRNLFEFLNLNYIYTSIFPNNILRISTSFITTKEEIDFLIKKIEEFLSTNCYK